MLECDLNYHYIDPETIILMFDAGVISLNEARQMLGLLPLEDNYIFRGRKQVRLYEDSPD